MNADDKVRELTRQLLIELGVHVKGGQITLHMDHEGRVQQVETKTFRKLRSS